MLTVPLDDLLDLGPTSARWLRDIGVESYDELDRLGSVEAYQLVKQVHPEGSADLLYALEGALRDVRWDLLPVADRAVLRRRAGC